MFLKMRYILLPSPYSPWCWLELLTLINETDDEISLSYIGNRQRHPFTLLFSSYFFSWRSRMILWQTHQKQKQNVIESDVWWCLIYLLEFYWNWNEMSEEKLQKICAQKYDEMKWMSTDWENILNQIKKHEIWP